jgi:hypothetical protein
MANMGALVKTAWAPAERMNRIERSAQWIVCL